MSMFHELMMRKKEQIMYATIKGTLTENDGVFSGFSASNYLEIPKFDKTSAWEMVYCFTTPNSIDDMKGKGILQEDTTTTYKTRININSDGTGLNFFATSNGTSFDIATTGTGATNVLTTNTKYFLKFEFTGTQYIWSLKSTGDYSVLVTKNSTAVLRDNAYKLGTEANNHFTGSIDLPNSYIKLGSTKYNLQAVVGYTVVGSPTITDGVMTNISGSNVIRVNTPIGNNWNSLEFNIKAKVSNLGSGHYGNIFGQSYYLLFRVTSSKYNLLYRKDGNSSWISKSINTVVSENSLYEVNLKISKDGKFVFYVYDNNGNLLDSLTFVDVDNIPIFDDNLTYGLLNGNITVNEIDLNNTYIKINNKLWFNGQQA